MGWRGIKNGELLRRAEDAGFDVIVTGDKAMEYQQDIKRRKIAVVALSAPHWPLVKNHVGRIAEAIATAKPGMFIRVDCGRFVPRRRRPTEPAP
jgi:hypothetical protein